MKLMINNTIVEIKTDESLYDLLKRLGMITGNLSSDPIAAKLAGRVFTLNYIPERHKDVNERESIRRAVTASGGVIKLLTYHDHAGRECYVRTAQFILFLL